MKNLIYFIGIGSLNLFLLGAISKMLLLPGAGILITLGLGIFAVVFLPIATWDAYQGHNDKTQFWVYITGFICAFVCIIGAIFKIQHFQGSQILLTIGIPLPFVVYLPVFLYNNLRSKTQSNNNFLGIMFLMTFIAIFTAFLSIKA